MSHIRSLLSRLFGRERITVSRVKDKRVSYDAAFRDKTMQLCRETKREFPLRPPAYDPNERVTIAEHGRQ